MMVLILLIAAGYSQLAVAEIRPQDGRPDSGGVHIEGLVGKPRNINPLFASTNAVDRDLVRLIFSGLVKTGNGREILPDLAESWEAQDQGKTYIFKLRENVTWHDGKPLTAEDVIFTYQAVLSDEYTGVLKSNFLGVTVERVDERAIKFGLPAAASSFLYDLTLGIVPQHIFGEIPVNEWPNALVDMEIVGTGPYRYERDLSDDSVSLKSFKDYYSDKPYIDSLVFYFFDNEKHLAAAFQNRTVSAAGFIEPVAGVGPADNYQAYGYKLPQYRGVFFNQLSPNPAMANVRVRQALAFAVNKPEIIETVEGGATDIVDSPVLDGFWGHNPDMKKYPFDLSRAASTLKENGWQDVDGDGFLEKDNVRLSVRISVRNDKKSEEIAELIAKYWRMIGCEVRIESQEISALIKDTIRPRSYEVLIFGQDLGNDSDPYVYWHSSQIKDPGLALAVGVDKDIDNNLEQARISPTLQGAIPYYINFQNAFAETVPAILLYQPKYHYLVDTKVRGVTDKINLSSLSDRFANIGQWYVRTKKSS